MKAYRQPRLTIRERLENILANAGFMLSTPLWTQHGDYRKAEWDLAVWGAEAQFEGCPVTICSWSTMTAIVKAGGITWSRGLTHTSTGNQSNDIEIFPVYKVS